MQRLLCIAFLICTSVISGCVPPPETVPTNLPSVPNQDERPNIIFILTDDQDRASLEFMPNVQSLLVDQGTSFSNYFITFPLCCPSRSTILRGQYTHNTKVFGNLPPQGGFQQFHKLNEDSTIATWLQSAGYHTAFIGKYLNGYPGDMGDTYIPPGWDDWYSAVSGNPYAEYQYTLNENGKLVHYGKSPNDYGTDVYRDQALRVIEEAPERSTPFFMYVSVYAPHLPATPAPRHKNMFNDMQMPRSPSFNEADVSDKPEHIKSQPPLSDRDAMKMDEEYRNRLRSLQPVDEMVASLIDSLETTGQLDNTYIVFSSDNGYHLGEHRLRAGKQHPYEEDIHVPLIVRGPHVPAGETLDELVGNVDLAPTFAEWASATTPDFVDGRSFSALLTQSDSVEPWRDAFLLEFGNTADEPRQSRSAKRTLQVYDGIRTDDYLYVEYVSGERELYDLKEDPYQLENLVATAAPELVSELSHWLETLRECAGESCRTSEVFTE